MKKIFYAMTLMTLAASSAFAQTPAPAPTPTAMPQTAATPASLETILSEAEKQKINYQETFKDLLATETKTFEEYDKDGEIDRETVVESNFLVYQSSKDKEVSSELRNITKINGKLVPDSQARADKFLAELQKSKTLEKELEKIQDEGVRYDKTIDIINFTIFEGVTLAERIRPNFEFKLLGTEDYNGSRVYVVSYQQTKKSPLIVIDEKEPKNEDVAVYYDIKLPGALKKNEKFLQGKLWIDAATFQLWREERRVAVQQTNGAPLIIQETVFEYNLSEFGILVPKKIVFLDNSVKKNSGNFGTAKDTKVTFDYSKFRKTNVEVLISDDEN